MLTPATEIQIEFYGPIVDHSLLCWICHQNPAVYHMNPVWAFSPCWECSKQIGGTLFRIQTKWQRIFLKR